MQKVTGTLMSDNGNHTESAKATAATAGPQGEAEESTGLQVGTTLQVTAEKPAHGGETIGTTSAGVIFLDGALPGDTVMVEVTQRKKSFSRGRVTSVLESGPYRGASRCAAADAGAGCCDFHQVIPEREAELKQLILEDQLRRVGKFTAGSEELPQIRIVPIDEQPGTRTRARFGVGADGKAGVRRRHSTDVITERCSAIDPRIYDEVEKHSFTPGAEVVCAVDSLGEVHVTETARAPRGKRVKHSRKVVAGSPLVTEKVGDTTFVFPVTGFWQAHREVPEIFSTLIREAASYAREDDGPASEDEPLCGWDLYGGVGALAPALVQALGGHNAEVISVDTTYVKDWQGSDHVSFARGDVAGTIPILPQPQFVVLDPPRTGAGFKTIGAIAVHKPHTVVHFGCDPATCARDLRSWVDYGYRVVELNLVNAFPGSYHFETVAVLVAP